MQHRVKGGGKLDQQGGAKLDQKECWKEGCGLREGMASSASAPTAPGDGPVVAAPNGIPAFSAKMAWAVIIVAICSALYELWG